MPKYMRYQNWLSGGRVLTITLHQCQTTRQFLVKTQVGTTEFDQEVVSMHQYGTLDDAAVQFATAVTNQLRGEGMPSQPWTEALYGAVADLHSTYPHTPPRG